MQPPELPLPKDDRILLIQLDSALSRASGIFELMSQEAQRQIHEYQNPVASLPYCLRWGLRACAELIEKSTATFPEEIWLTKQQLAKRLKLRPAVVEKLIRQKVFVAMVREGTPYFGWNECGDALNRFRAKKD